MAKRKSRGFKTMSDNEREQAYNRKLSRGLSYIDSNIPIFKPRQGENCVRIVPPLADDALAADNPWGVDIIQYFIDGHGYFISPKVLGRDTRDPIEEGIRELKKKEPELLEDGAAATSRRILMFILDLNEDTENGELKLWSCPNTVAEDFVRAAKHKRTGATYSLEDPDEGRPIFFETTGAERNTRYTGFQLDDQELPLDDDILDKLEYFEDIILIEEDETLESAIQNVGDTEDRSTQARGRAGTRGRGKEDEEEEARSSRRSRKSRRGSADDEEEEDTRSKRGRRSRKSTDDDEEEEDDHASPPPRDRGGRKRKSRDPDEEEEPEADEEEEEPEDEGRTSRRGRGKSKGRGKSSGKSGGRFRRTRGGTDDEEEEESDEEDEDEGLRDRVRRRLGR